MVHNRPYYNREQEVANYISASKNGYDMWVASLLGTASPVLYRSGWYLPVMNFATGEEGLYCYAEDIVYTGKEYWARISEAHQYGATKY